MNTQQSNKSRSNFKKATNDRYLPTDFDFVFSDTSNAFFKEGRYELIDIPDKITAARLYYDADNMEEVMQKAISDIYFIEPSNILHTDRISIDRGPKMSLNENNNWHKIVDFEEYLTNLIDNS